MSSVRSLTLSAELELMEITGFSFISSILFSVMTMNVLPSPDLSSGWRPEPDPDPDVWNGDTLARPRIFLIWFKSKNERDISTIVESSKLPVLSVSEYMYSLELELS